MATYPNGDYPVARTLEDCKKGLASCVTATRFSIQPGQIATEPFKMPNGNYAPPGWYEATAKIPNWWQTFPEDGYGYRFGRYMVLLSQHVREVSATYRRDDLVPLGIVHFEPGRGACAQNTIGIYAPYSLLRPVAVTNRVPALTRHRRITL